ncbi:MAG TPA: alpha/beta fold hydrolase [Solirubrobacterales bacterium]|jgi:pimeloyl-ACP methyl ester carboxylesterase|nr:alpha/beta fold hydrolase [Solirubrobacterales bacterium]
MASTEVSAGTIHYEEIGNGPPLVMVGGLAMNGRLWERVAAELAPTHRCLMPTLPFGAHPEPMSPDADLSLRGMGRIVAEFIESLGLEAVILCFNDWSGAQVMVADGLLGRVSALVLVSCETEGNYPPGLAGRAAILAAKMPGGLSLMRRTLLAPSLRRLPFIYGQMSKRGVPDDLMREWLEPLRRPEIRRDVRKYIGDVGQGRRDMAAATPALGRFERPVLVVWDRDGSMMPNDEGRKLAADFADARLVEIADSYTLIPIDQPLELAAVIREFALEPAAA